MKCIIILLLLCTVAQIIDAWLPGKQWMQKTAAAALSVTIALSPAIADPIPIVGADAPSFVLPSNAGKDISLNDLKGKLTVLYFYPGDFTQGCTIEAQGFERDFSKYQALGADILGVSVDSVDKHLDFKKQYGLEFPLASDNGGIVSNKYGSLLDLSFLGKFSNRQTYIIGPDLKIKAVFTGVEDRLTKHSSEVLSKLEEITGKKL